MHREEKWDNARKSKKAMEALSPSPHNLMKFKIQNTNRKKSNDWSGGWEV